MDSEYKGLINDNLNKIPVNVLELRKSVKEPLKIQRSSDFSTIPVKRASLDFKVPQESKTKGEDAAQNSIICAALIRLSNKRES